MPDTRFTLIGKACVWIVRASDSQLRTLLKSSGWKGLKKVKRKRSPKQRANDKKLGMRAKARARR